ncbi:iron ABC transporter permease [Bradymonadaceae bacterium TMQ3]|nr:iron ABC transporter permease [Bradymonadaceae bacterium TMQ3]TXC76008.1 iron chelate uptake ABC transporter family permease subunit [Bradymonadales bacterium TMQ1]
MTRAALTPTKIALSAALTLGLWGLSAMLGLSSGSSALGGFDLVARWWTGELSATEQAILWSARLPRVVFAGVVGAALAAGGAVFQAVLRNPLADPYILGVSGGAALGGTLLLTLGSFSVGGLAVSTPLAAFGGALAALAAIFAVARQAPSGRGATYVLLLTGVIVNAFAASMIMFLQSVVSAQKAQEILFYLMGALSVEGTAWPVMLGVSAAIGLSLTALFAYARDLNAMAIGEEEAAYLGVEVAKVQRVCLLLASFAVAVGVAFSGIIGFVGLVVPHAMRLVVGPDHRVLLPTSALAGAAFLTLADVSARSLFGVLGTTLPVGVLTSMIGAPMFLYFLWRALRRDAGWG